MEFSEIAGRITGISTPIFGVSWTPPQLDRDVAQAVIVYLEDRWVFYDPYDVELPDYTVQSVFDIRRHLTEVLARGGIANELGDTLRACEPPAGSSLAPTTRKTTEGCTCGRAASTTGSARPSTKRSGSCGGVFGLHVAQLAVRYGIDVPDELATILPLDPAQDLAFGL